MERATEEEGCASEGRPRGHLGTTTPRRGLVVGGPGAAPKHTHAHLLFSHPPHHTPYAMMDPDRPAGKPSTTSETAAKASAWAAGPRPGRRQKANEAVLVGVWKATAEAGEAAGKVGAAGAGDAQRGTASASAGVRGQKRTRTRMREDMVCFVVQGCAWCGWHGRTTPVCRKKTAPFLFSLTFTHKSVDSPLSHTQMPLLRLTASLAVLAAFAATAQAAASSKANEQELTQVLATVRVCEKKRETGAFLPRRAPENRKGTKKMF